MHPTKGWIGGAFWFREISLFRGGGGIDDDARKKLGENTKEMKRDGKGEIVDSYEICFNIILERKLLKKNCNFEFIFNPGSG